LSDPELRRRHPEAELPPLHIAEEAVTSGAAHEASVDPSGRPQLGFEALQFAAPWSVAVALHHSIMMK
jgi:hypothetical protein